MSDYNIKEEYQIIEDVYESAEEYYDNARDNIENGKIGRPLMVSIQLAAEEYLHTMIEILYGKTFDEIAVYRNSEENKYRKAHNENEIKFSQHLDLTHKLDFIYNNYLYPKTLYAKNTISDLKIPYNIFMENKMLSNRQKLLPSYDINMANELRRSFNHYNNIRYAKDKNINVRIMSVMENDIKEDFEMLYKLRGQVIELKNKVQEQEMLRNTLFDEER